MVRLHGELLGWVAGCLLLYPLLEAFPILGPTDFRHAWPPQNTLPPKWHRYLKAQPRKSALYDLSWPHEKQNATQCGPPLSMVPALVLEYYLGSGTNQQPASGFLEKAPALL